MISQNSITKQIYINKLTISNDLSNEIKSFCFYDTKTWELMNFITPFNISNADYL